GRRIWRQKPARGCCGAGTVKRFFPACPGGGRADGAGMYVGWTTVETREQADTLARELVEARLVACVQVEGPIRSTYRWQGRVQQGDEYRLTVKYVAQRQAEIETWLLTRHPYDNPEW